MNRYSPLGFESSQTENIMREKTMDYEVRLTLLYYFCYFISLSLGFMYKRQIIMPTSEFVVRLKIILYIKPLRIVSDRC